MFFRVWTHFKCDSGRSIRYRPIARSPIRAPCARSGWRSYKAEYHKLDTHLLRPLAAPLPAELSSL